MNGSSHDLRNKYARIGRTALIVGLLGVVGLAVGWLLDPDDFYQSYIFGYAYWITITLGMIGWMLLHNMTAGKWGFAIRRILQSATFNGKIPYTPIVLMAVLFIPIIIGSGTLYHEWMDHSPSDHMLEHKSFYLNEPFWYARIIFYFLFWILLTATLKRMLSREERVFDPAQSNLRKIGRVSSFGMVLFALTVNFAVTDWFMSLEPHWYSTIYGVIFLVGGALSAMALTNVTLVTGAKHEPFHSYLDVKTFHDLGNLMFALTVFWAYVSFSQYIIIWSANLAEESAWYIKRSNGPNEYIAYGLLVFHFIFPFLMLIQRRMKRNPMSLRPMAIYILVVHALDIFWQIKPAFQDLEDRTLNFHLLDLAALAGIGGLWLFLFFTALAKSADPLVTINDQRMKGPRPVLDETPATVNA